MSSNVDQKSSKQARESIWLKLRRESGIRLREERTRLNLSQAVFAEKVGVHRRTQVNYEAGEREPDGAYYDAAAALGVDVVYVTEGERLQGLPAFAARIAGRLFGSSARPTNASAEAMEALFYLFGLDEVEYASREYTITPADAESLVNYANKGNSLFEQAFAAISKYSTRLDRCTPSELAKLVLETMRRYENESPPASRSHNVLRLIADDVVDEHRAQHR